MPFSTVSYCTYVIPDRLTCIDNLLLSTVNERKKRSFKSYFENYLDEMATSACVAMGSKGGLYFAVRRKCGTFASCKEICKSTTIRRQAQIWDPSK